MDAHPIGSLPPSLARTLSRRAVLHRLAASGVAATLLGTHRCGEALAAGQDAATPVADLSRGPIVTVPGAFLGGWHWQRVRPLLWDAGRPVFTLTLTGLGERAHLATPETDLDTHIQDVVGTLEAEDVQGAVLVGHSYGGMVITGVADRVPERVGLRVVLDGLIPEDGQSAADLTGGIGTGDTGPLLSPDEAGQDRKSVV
jgi:pimeloyl-ACP methyl ester carboxylesterase